MRIYLFRHFESLKNKRNTLSSREDREGLTERGRTRCVDCAEALGQHLRAEARCVDVVYTSASERGVQSGELIAKFIGEPEIQPCQFLRSTRAGAYAGLSSAQLRRFDPVWHRSFELYKKGLFNLYKFDTEWHAEGKESKADFEQRVMDGFYDIISKRDGDTVLIVANRSAIIAILLHFARQLYGYPQHFYGYVRIDLGSVSVLERAEGGGWSIKAANRVITRGQTKVF